MKLLALGNEQALKVSEVGVGCMRMSGLDSKEIISYLEKTQELGINFFDHADIYGQGECEAKFGRGLKDSSLNREDLMIQSKCGIRPGFFDFSKEHIISSVEGILERLDTDYLDVLALHRPDTLMEPEEVTEAFVMLKASGKVRHFGVSNQNPMQIDLLSRYLNPEGIRLLVNQVQFSLAYTPMIDHGLNVNMQSEANINRDGSMIEYSRLHEMTLQAWSPFQFGFFEGVFIDHEKYPELNKVMAEMAGKYSVTKTGLAVAWINRHPAKIQTLVGTMNEQRLEEITAATRINLTREDWYALYRAAGNILP